MMKICKVGHHYDSAIYGDKCPFCPNNYNPNSNKINGVVICDPSESTLLHLCSESIKDKLLREDISCEIVNCLVGSTNYDCVIFVLNNPTDYYFYLNTHQIGEDAVSKYHYVFCLTQQEHAQFCKEYNRIFIVNNDGIHKLVDYVLSINTDLGNGETFTVCRCMEETAYSENAVDYVPKMIRKIEEPNCCYCSAPPESFTPKLISNKDNLSHNIRNIFNKKRDVNSAVCSPAEVEPGDDFLVQVYLYKNNEYDEVIKKAKIVDKYADIRQYEPLQSKLRTGDSVTIKLIMPDVVIKSDTKVIKWRGKMSDCCFEANMPENIKKNKITGRIVVIVNGMPCGELCFNTKIKNNANKNIFAEAIPRLYKKVFISYSHKDYDKVKYMVEGFKASGDFDLFFDRHTLKPGDVFLDIIYDAIDKSDVFILWWSANSMKSEWVKKEMQRALLVVENPNSNLRLYPLIIEPKADLPSDMEKYSFGEIE